MLSGGHDLLNKAKSQLRPDSQGIGLPMYSRSRSKERKPRLRNTGSTQGPVSTVQTYLSKWSASQQQQQREPIRSSLVTPSNMSPSQGEQSTIVFVMLCIAWYSSSALSSNTGKAILTQFRYPITLTFVQFGFVALYCLLFMSPLVGFSKLRTPTKAILTSTLPMGLFQVGGHVFSSMAISRIPVSTVHTIKVSTLLV